MKRLALLLICAVSLFASEWHGGKLTQSDYFQDQDDRAAVVDSSGNPHVVYGGDHLYYTHYNGSAWQVDLLDEAVGVGAGASMAIDSEDNLYIVYADDYNKKLKFKYIDHSGFQGEPVWIADIGSSNYRHTAVAVDNNKTISVVYTDYASNALKYIKFPSGGLQLPPVTLVSSYFGNNDHSIAVDASGVLHIAYSSLNEHALKYISIAPDDSTDYQTLDVSEITSFYHPSIAAGFDGKVHISYFDMHGALKYVQIVSGTPSTPAVLNSDRNSMTETSIAVNNSGDVFIAFQDAGDVNLLKRTADGTVSLSAISTPESDGRYPTIALNALGFPHIFHYDYSNALYHTGIFLTASTVLVHQGGMDSGAYSAVAFDQNKTAHIVYTDDTDNFIKYNTKTASGYSGIPASLSIGGTTNDLSILSDSLNRIRLILHTNSTMRHAFLDTGATLSNIKFITSAWKSSAAADTSGNIHFAYCAESTLRYGIIDTSGEAALDEMLDDRPACESPSVAIDKNQNIHIAYADYAGYEDRYAKVLSNGTLREPITIDGLSINIGAVTTDSEGHAHIIDAVFSSTTGNKTLRHIHFSAEGTVLAIEPLPVDDIQPAESTAVVTDRYGVIHFAYIDTLTKTLNVLSGRDGHWNTPVRIADYAYDGKIGMALSADQKLLITYHDDFDKELAYRETQLQPPMNMVPILHYLLH